MERRQLRAAHEFLKRERATNPPAARERLTKSLDELPAKERADLLGVLSDGLGPDDEPLLDGLRADRSREVRQAACALLLRLPLAAHPRRAAARIGPLLGHERVLLRKRWQIDAPAAVASRLEGGQHRRRSAEARIAGRTRLVALSTRSPGAAWAGGRNTWA